jgi:raffinose/stachyose/melibiose transport system substrate-binding protein
MQKTIAILLILGLSAAATEGLTLSMVYAGGDSLTKESIHEVVSAFEKANPGVDIAESPSIAGSSYLEYVQVLDAAGQFPDLIEMRDAPQFIRAGKLAPLPEEVAALVVDPIRFGGKVYTVSQVAQAPLGMIYNAKFFRENKLSEPRTYAKFLELLDAIKARKATPIVVGGKDLWHLSFTFTKYYIDEVASKNPNFIADRYAGKVKFTDSPMRRALAAWAELFSPGHGWVDPGFYNVADNQTASALIGDKAIMLYSGTWMLQQIHDADPLFEIGWFPVPSPADDKINLVGGSTAQGWAMSAEAAKDPAKAKAILGFIKFFFRKDNYQNFLRRQNGIPSTTERVSYQSAVPVMGKILDIYYRTAGKQLMWNQNVGANELPPGFRDYAYMQCMELLLGARDVDSTARALDAQWESATRDFNPAKAR